MQVVLIFIISMGMAINALGLEPQKVYGAYIWGEQVYLNETHHWENGLLQSADGQARMKELKKQGYSCYRRSQTKFTCHAKSLTAPLPDEVKKFAGDYAKSVKVEFRGPFANPKDMIKTSTEQEWWIEGEVWINGTTVTGYKWTDQFEPHKDFVVLPVNDEQPIPWFIYKSTELLHLPLQVQTKDGPDKITKYLLEVNMVSVE